MIATGDRPTINKKAREMSQSGVPKGFVSVESWDATKGRNYLEDGSRAEARDKARKRQLEGIAAREKAEGEVKAAEDNLAAKKSPAKKTAPQKKVAATK